MDAVSTPNLESFARCLTSKDDVTGETCAFSLESVVLGEDDAGDEIASCVIAPGAAGGVGNANRAAALAIAKQELPPHLMKCC